ncbi:hypothetical protein AAHC03_016482 [Spirometra sp. Aus1]
MDWHQFVDPQIVLGLGAFAFGLANAYVQRHFNRGDQTDNNNQPGDPTTGLPTVTEEAGLLTSPVAQSPNESSPFAGHDSSPKTPATSSWSTEQGEVEGRVLAEVHSPASFTESIHHTEGAARMRDALTESWAVPVASADAADEDESKHPSDFSDSSLADSCNLTDMGTVGDHQARRRERRRRHKLRKGHSYDESPQGDSRQLPATAPDDSVGAESDDSTLRANVQSLGCPTTVERAVETSVLVTCLDDVEQGEKEAEEQEEEEEEEEDEMYQSVETIVGSADAERETSPQATQAALISHPADAATLSQTGISSTLPQPLSTRALWQPVINLEPCLNRHLARIAASPIANFAAFPLAVCEIQRIIRTGQSARQPPGTVDHATDTYQISTFREVFPQRICPHLIDLLPIGEEAFAIREPTESISVEEDFLVRRQEESFYIGEGPVEETDLFPRNRPLEEISEGEIGEELAWKEELTFQQPKVVPNPPDLHEAPVSAQEQTFQGGDVQTLDFAQEVPGEPSEASSATDISSETVEPLRAEAVKSSVNQLGELSAFEKVHSYSLILGDNRAVEKLVRPGDSTSREYLEEPVEESAVVFGLTCDKSAPSTAAAQLSQKRVRFAPAEVTEIWSGSDLVDSTTEEQSPSTDKHASFLPSVSIPTDSHIVLPSEHASQFSVLEATVSNAKAEATGESLNLFTPEVVEISSTNAVHDNEACIPVEVKSQVTTSEEPVEQKPSGFPAVTLEANDFCAFSQDSQRLPFTESGLAVTESLKDEEIPTSYFSNLSERQFQTGDHLAVSNETRTAANHTTLCGPTENQTEELLQEENSDLPIDFSPEKLVSEVYTADSCGILPENWQHFVFDQPPVYSDAKLIAPVTAAGAFSQTFEYIFAGSEEIAQATDAPEKDQSFRQGKAEHNRTSLYSLLNTLPEELAVHIGKEDESPTSAMAFTHAALSSAVALRRRSFHFQFDSDSFDGSENLFTVWQKQSPVGKLFFASFSVDRETRSGSPDLLTVEEGERLECLDADNPDRWVIGRPPSGFANDPDSETRGRGNAVCMLTHPPAKLSRSGNTREQFREEVLNISNKKQESSIRQKYALTEVIEMEEGYAVRVKRLERLLASLTGKIVEEGKSIVFPVAMQQALEGLGKHLSATIKLSEKLRAQMQMCAMNPTNAAQCFLDLEPEFAHYTAYLVHLSHLMNAYEKTGIKKQEVCFELRQLTGTPPPSASVGAASMDAMVTGGTDASEARIGARQFFEQLFIPQAHLTSYESLLGYLARYAARSHKPTRGLEAAMTVVRQASRRAVELQQLWPFVVDMPPELGSLPPKDAAIQDLERLPKPVVRMTHLTTNRRKGGRLKSEGNIEGFLILDPKYLIFLTEQSEPTDARTYNVAWQIPLSDLRISQGDQKEVGNSTFELWDVRPGEGPVKSIIAVEATSALSAETWLQDLEKGIRSQGVDPFLDKETMEAHETADLESRKRYSQLVELDDWTEGEDQFSELYYDVDELVQSVDGEIYDPDIILHQLTSAEGDDETSLTYYTAEGSIQHIAATGTRKGSTQNVRPASMISADSVGTVDEVPNPFVEQKPRSGSEELTNEVVLTQSVSAAKPFEHHAELQNINSSEGGELELTICTSSSEEDAFTATWTFEGQPLSSSFGAQTRVEGSSVILGVPAVTQAQHEGRYECTLVWPGGMRAVFPFQVKVHPAEDDVALTNDSGQQLRVRTIEQASVTVTEQFDEEDDSFAGGKGILLAPKVNKNALGVVEVTTVPDVTQVATAATVSTQQHVGEPGKADLSTAAVPTYYATSASVHSVEHDHVVPHFESVPETPSSSKAQIVPNTTELEKAITSDVDVKQHTAPQFLVVKEGDKLAVTLPVQLDSKTLREAKVFWTKDGKTVATLSAIARTSKTDFSVSVNQAGSGKTAEACLSKAKCAQEDVGEYILWVEPKASRFGPKQEAKEWGRICVRVEKPTEEGKEKDQAPEARKETVEEAIHTEETELTTDSSKSTAQPEKGSESPGDAKMEGDKRRQKDEADTVKKKKAAEEAGEEPKRKKSSGEGEEGEKTATDGAPSKTPVAPTELEEATLQAQKTTPIQKASEEQEEKKAVPEAVDNVKAAEKAKEISERPANDLKAASAAEEKATKEQKSVAESKIKKKGEEQEMKDEIDKEKEGEKRRSFEEKEEKHKTKKASKDKKTVVEDEQTRAKVPITEAAATNAEEVTAKLKTSEKDEKRSSDMEASKMASKKETAVSDEEKVRTEAPSTEATAVKPEKSAIDEKRSKDQDAKKAVESVKDKKEPSEVPGKDGQSAKVAEEKTATEKKPMEAPVGQDTKPENLITLAVGDKLKLTALANLDAKQLKTSNVYWTKDGKQIADLNFAPRTATFTARSLPKPPRATEVDLLKKTAAEVEDCGTYCLMSEPKIKSIRNNQPTQHAVFQLVVAPPPPPKSEEPESSPEVDKVEDSKEAPGLVPSKDKGLGVEEKDKQAEPVPAVSPAAAEGAGQRPSEEVADVPVIANAAQTTSQMEDLKPEELPGGAAETISATEASPVEETGLSVDKEVHEVLEIPAPEEEEGKKPEKKPKKVKKTKKHREKTGEEEEGEVGVTRATEDAVPGVAASPKAEEQLPPPVIRCVELEAMKMMGDRSVVTDEGQPLCLTVVGLPEDYESAQWTRDGTPLSSSDVQVRQPFASPSHVGEFATQLLIKAVSPDDAGVYELTAASSKSPAAEAVRLAIPVEVRKSTLPEAEGATAPKTADESVLQVSLDRCRPMGLAPHEGDPLVLAADLKVPFEQVRPDVISWTHNGVAVEGDDNTQMALKASPDGDATSIILQRAAVSFKDAGTYRIHYQPQLTEPIIEETSSQETSREASPVDVAFPRVVVISEASGRRRSMGLGQETRRPKPPQLIKVLPAELNVTRGDTVTLEAETAGVETVVPVWLVNGREVDPGRTTDYVIWHSGTYFALTIPAVDSRHLGNYELRLMGEGGEVITNCQLNSKSMTETPPKPSAVRPTALDGIAPMFTKKLSDIDCERGEEIRMTCRVVGDPLPHLLWRHNERYLEGSDDRRSIRTHDNTSTLVIRPVEPSDRGVYVCSAANEFGKSQTSARLIVDGRASPFEEEDFEGDAIPRLGINRTLSLPRDAPDGLMVEKANPEELRLKWSPLPDPDITYTIEVSKDNGRWWQPVISGIRETSAVVPPEHSYPLQPIQVRLLAENSNGTGPPSTPVLRIPARACIPQMASVKPILKPADLGSVLITWPDTVVTTARDMRDVSATARTQSAELPAPNEMLGNLSYSVEVREGARGEWKEVVRGLKDRSYVHHLKPGVSTMVRLRASNQFGTSEPSPTAIANLPQEDLIPDMASDAPWVSVIRPDLNKREGVLSAPGGPVTAGLMLHWKPAYLPEYCSKCVSGLEPVYRIEWRRSRAGPWLGLADDIVGTDSFRLPNHVIRALAEQQASQPSSLRSGISSNPIEVRVICHNDYGSTLPTKSVRLTGFGLFKSNYEESGQDKSPESSLNTLPIMTLPDGKPKLPLYLTSVDIDEGICLGWEDAFREPASRGNEAGSSLHGKYRLESCVVTPGTALETDACMWKPVGPPGQPLLGNSYCLDLKPHFSMEQRVRLLALTSSGDDDDSGRGACWMNAYEQVRVPSRRQLLPNAVDSFNAKLVQNPDATFSVKLGWLPAPLPEGEDILQAQLSPSVFEEASRGDVSYRIEVQDGSSAYGGWREIGTVVGREQTTFLHKSPSTEAQLSYRVTPFNKYGDGPSSVVPAVSIPRRLSELQGCVEDLRVLILGPREISLRWRLGDTALDTLEQMGRRMTTSERGRGGGGGMSDSGYALSDDDLAAEELREHVHFSVERRDAFGGEWYTVEDRLPGGLTGKVILYDCPREMHGSEYRITAWLNGQPCAPSRPARISVKAAELTPDMSYQKPAIDTSKVGEYHISWQDNDLESLYSRHALAATLPQSLEKDLTYEIQVLKDSSRDWETLVSGLTSPSWSWSGVDPLLPYSIRVIGRNQFGVGQPSRATHVEAQVVIPDLSFVIPVVREASGILEGREPAELRWQLPRAYTLNNTLTPFTYEVQVRPVGDLSAEWSVLAAGLKVPHCQLNQLRPDQEYALRVVAVTEFGRGKPSQVARKRRGRGDSRSLSMAASGYASDQKAAAPEFEDPAPSVIYLPLGADLDLRCSLTSQSLREPVRFSWSFNFQPIPDDPKLSQFPMGYFQGVSMDGRSAQLRLADISEHDLGTYTCKAMNRHGSVVKEFRVLRADAPVITEVPPPIVTLSLHQTLLLPCWVDAIPPAKVTWTRDSRRITSSYRTHIGGEVEEQQLAAEKWIGDEEQFELTRDASLRVDQCIFQDAGLYTMVAENPAGRAQISCIVRVEDNPIPKDITPRWTSIDRHYFVLRPLATGSFSRSHLLIDKQTNREYVGKIYELDDLITRVLGAREVECLGRMHHSNIVELVDAVVSDNHLILITERLCGNHLLEEVLLAHSWSEAAVALLVRQLLEAVAHMHSQGVVHLDIQPENIIFPRAIDALREDMPASQDIIQSLSSLTVDTAGSDGRCDFGVVSSLIRLTGFSMAQPIFDRDCLQSASILPPLHWCADFAAPELIRMADQTVPLDMDLSVGCAADIWSIGMVTYVLLSGGHPTIRQPEDQLRVDDLQTIAANLESGEGLENVSPEALDFLGQLLSFDPRDRPTASACLHHPWLTATDKASRNLEPNLPRLRNYHQLYQQRKGLPTESWRTENFLKFAGEACELSLPRAASRAPSAQPDVSRRGFSIDRELTERIASIMLPPEERGMGSEASSTNSSMLNLDAAGLEEGLPTPDSRSPRRQLSPPPATDPWLHFRESRSPGRSAAETRLRDTLSPSQIFSSEDSSRETKRLCEQLAESRMETVAPVDPQLHSVEKINEFSADTRMAPSFATPLHDSHIDPRTGEAFFACQLAGVPRLPFLEALLQRGNKEALRTLLPPGDFDNRRGGEVCAPSTAAAAWYLGGCLLSDGPGVSLGAAEGGWLWLRLDNLNRSQAGKTVECVVRNRAGKARTRARILLPEPPREPSRPGVIEAGAKEAIVAWASGNNDCCEDLIYKLDVKFPDEKPATTWRTIGFTADCRFFIHDMLPDTHYRVRVSVRNSAGWSGYSIASSEFKTASDPAVQCSSLSADEMAWMLCWRQSTHPFGLSDHPEALLNRPLKTSSAFVFENPPAPNALLELQQFHGLFASIESIRALCSLEGLISRGHFDKLLLLRCHPALVERVPVTGQNFSGCLPAYLVARITQTKEAPDSERRARQRALVFAYLNSSAGSRVTASPAAGDSPFTQQFAGLSALLPVGLSLGWLANDAARPSAGISLCQWAPGGRLLDVLRARGEYTEFSIARWTHQLLMALRWLFTALRGRLHGCINFDTVLAVKRVSSLPDIMLAGFEPIDETLPAHLRGNCFVAPEKETGENYSQLTDLWSVGVFAYLMMTANVKQQSATTDDSPQSVLTESPADSQPATVSGTEPSVLTEKTGYEKLTRPTVNLKLIKNFSKWAKRFVYNTLQSTPINRGSLDFWLEFEWFSLRPEVVKQLASTTIPSHGLLNYRTASSFYGILPCGDDELSVL